jgi:predicted ATPase
MASARVGSMRPLLSLDVQNYRSLQEVSVELGPVNVLVGPNQAGKSNLLDVIAFLGDSARLDLPQALEKRGGLSRVRYRGESDSGSVHINVRAQVTKYSHEGAPDEYGLAFHSRRLATGRSVLIRREHFTFKRTKGRGRRITVKGSRAEITDEGGKNVTLQTELPLKSDSLALSTLRRLPPNEGGEEIERIARLFTTFRVFNVDVRRARQAGRLSSGSIAHDASNLASVLLALSDDEERFADFLDDARAMVPGLQRIEFEPVESAGAPTFTVKIAESGLKDATYIEDASFGTVRILALLALLYDPEPPQITCIEEVDHGLHPYVFDRLVEIIRDAAQRTQLIIATHSPSFVNRLDPSELIVCERDYDGYSRIPAVDPKEIIAKADAVGGRLQLGEMWFSGSLGGVPR